MLLIVAYALTLNGKRYPFIVFFFALGIAIYQFVSGRLLNSYWRAWLTRKDHPRAYWTVLAIEFALILLGFYLGTL